MHTISTDAVALYMNFIYWVAIPGIYLMNNNDLKSWVMDNNLYIEFTNRFFPSTINTIDFNKHEDESDFNDPIMIPNRMKINNWVEEVQAAENDNNHLTTESK